MTEDKCEQCGDDIDDINVESWETTGKLLCAGCAEEAFEADAYEPNDPKSPGWYDRMADRADALRKRERGE